MTPLPPPGAHGGDGERVARALGLPLAEILDLSQSLNPAAPDPRPIVAAHLDGLVRYPDPGAATTCLAATMGVAPERLLLTNGGAEAIALVAALRGGYVREPEFSLHPRSGGPFWRSNPQSPSGLLASEEERAEVWDEAFYPLATGRWTRGEEGATVVGSLTKVLACPGLRIGYVLADPDTITTLGRLQPHWSLNGLAAAALGDLLAGIDVQRHCEQIRSWREELRGVLESHGLRVRPSDANWLLVERGDLRERLAPRGIVVRDCSSFGWPDVTRIAVPDADGIDRVDAALRTLDRGT
jgi:histidinol-phosphate/aromatic aminotransferase/cobyric acid decarboxylase-like protein